MDAIKSLQTTPLRLAEDVRVWPVHERGKLIYRLEIPASHQFFRVGYEEYVLISYLDGQTPLVQACGFAAAKLGRRAPTTEQAEKIAQWLIDNELVSFEESPRRRRGICSSSIRQRKERKAITERINPFWMKFPLVRSESLIARISYPLRTLFTPVAIAFAFLLFATAILLLGAHWDRFANESRDLFLPSSLVWTVAIWLGLKVIHELAHAACAFRMGASARELGLVFVLFAPLAYVDVSSCWRLNSRWRRIAVAVAGIYVEMIIAAAAFIAWSMCHREEVAFVLHRLVLTAGISTIVFNANPLMRFDGYYVLTDCIDIPNLYSESQVRVTRLLRKIVFGDADASDSMCGWRRWFVIGYGWSAMLWRGVICFSLLVAASTLLGGFGIALTIIALPLWFGRPLVRLFKEFCVRFENDSLSFWRGLIIGGGLACCLIGMITCVPISTSSHSASVVRYRPETIVRSRTDGFVRNVFVSNGDRVEFGQAIMKIENRMLEWERDSLLIELKQIDIRLNQATERKNAGERMVLEAKRESTEKRFAQLNSRCESMIVVATHAGIVVAEDLPDLVDRYVKEGDRLFVVADSCDKEVLTYVSQRQIEQARPTVDNPVRLLSKNGDVFEGQFESLDPRATDELFAESLSASNGGSLAVVRDRLDENRLRLLEPHFQGRIAISPDHAEAIPAGMSLKTVLNDNNASLWRRATHWMREVWYARESGSPSFD